MTTQDASARLKFVLREIFELREAKRRLGETRLALQGELSKITDQVRAGGWMNDSRYRSIVNQQRLLKGKIAEVDPQIAELKRKIHLLANEETEIRVALFGGGNSGKQEADTEIVSKLKTLRQKYVDFSSDSTRVASMRLMASKFAEELARVLNGELARAALAKTGAHGEAGG